MIGGSGVPLPSPQNPYGSLANPYAIPVPGIVSNAFSNEIFLLAGQRWTIPPGYWCISGGVVSTVQVLDPVTNTWQPVVSAARVWFINSDGNNWRVANLAGTPVSASVGAAGSGYVQATTTITSSAGGSTWTPIIGGAVNATVTIGNDRNGVAGGSNFTLAPLLVVDAPPTGGIQATASCTISAGAINAVTVQAAGAGYMAAPGIKVIPDPADPTLGAITIPQLTTTLTGSGTLTGVLLTYPGISRTSAPTLTVNGAGSSATATVNMFSTSLTSDTVFVQPLGSLG